jgi:hypothetical protein
MLPQRLNRGRHKLCSMRSCPPHRCGCSDFGLLLSHITTPERKSIGSTSVSSARISGRHQTIPPDHQVPGNAAPSHQSALLPEKWPPASTATRIHHPPGRPPHRVPGAKDPSASATTPRASSTNPATTTIFSRDQVAGTPGSDETTILSQATTLQRLTYPSHIPTPQPDRRNTHHHTQTTICLDNMIIK